MPDALVARPGASTAWSAGCSGATRAPPSSTSCCRCCSSCGGGAILHGNQHELDRLVPAIAGMSVMSTTFTALAYNIVFLRERGVLKRIRGTPLPTLLLLRRRGRQRRHQHGAADRDHRARRAASFFGIGWPARLGRADRVRARRGRLLRRARRRLRARRSPTSSRPPPTSTPCSCRSCSSPSTCSTRAARPASCASIAEALPLKPLIDGLYGAMVTGTGLGRQSRRARRDRPVGRLRAVLRRARLLLGAVTSADERSQDESAEPKGSTT